MSNFKLDTISQFVKKFAQKEFNQRLDRTFLTKPLTKKSGLGAEELPRRLMNASKGQYLRFLHEWPWWWSMDRKVYAGRAGIHCLVVIGGDSCLRGREFESQHLILDGYFSHFCCCQSCMVCSKRPKRNWNRTAIFIKRPFIRTIRVRIPLASKYFLLYNANTKPITATTYDYLPSIFDHISFYNIVHMRPL